LTELPAEDNNVARELVGRNPTWQKWAEWLGEDPKPGTIYKDVLDMRAARRVWEGFHAIVGLAPEDARKYGTFHSWVNGNYIRSQGLAARRQVDVADDVVSLGRLLDRIAKSPSVLSRKRYLAELHPTTPDLGNEFFDALVGPGAKALPAATPLADIERLREGTAKVRDWVSNEVAHYNAKTGQFSQGLTFGNVHAAMDLIFEIFNRYNQLILGRTVAASVSMPPWEAVFRLPWIPDDDAYRCVALAQQQADERRG
jgi:hypothetical protein